MLTFASSDAEAVRTFEAGWTLTIQNLRRGIREPLRPADVEDFAQSAAFRTARNHDDRMITGEPKLVAERLLQLKQDAQAAEVIVVPPGLHRTRRRDSYLALADAWRQVA